MLIPGRVCEFAEELAPHFAVFKAILDPAVGVRKTVQCYDTDRYAKNYRSTQPHRHPTDGVLDIESYIGVPEVDIYHRFKSDEYWEGNFDLPTASHTQVLQSRDPGMTRALWLGFSESHREEPIPREAEYYGDTRDVWAVGFGLQEGRQLLTFCATSLGARTVRKNYEPSARPITDIAEFLDCAKKAGRKLVVSDDPALV